MKLAYLILSNTLYFIDIETTRTERIILLLDRNN